MRSISCNANSTRSDLLGLKCVSRLIRNTSNQVTARIPTRPRMIFLVMFRSLSSARPRLSHDLDCFHIDVRATWDWTRERSCSSDLELESNKLALSFCFSRLLARVESVESFTVKSVIALRRQEAIRRLTHQPHGMDAVQNDSSNRKFS
jgi:hypothetical protein